MNLLDLPIEIIDIIISPENIGDLGRAVFARVCRGIIVRRSILPKKYVCNDAIANGYIEIYQWARKNGCHCGRRAHVIAAKNGQTDALKWMLAHGYTFNKNICAHVAYNNHLETLQWLYLQGYPLSTWTFACAARKGHLHIVEWLHQHGCLYTALAVWLAIGYNRTSIIAWFVENHPDWFKQHAESVICGAISAGNLDIIELHTTRGYIISELCCAVITLCGPLNIIDWAHQQGIEINTDLLALRATEHNLYDIALWIQSKNLVINDPSVRAAYDHYISAYTIN